MDEAYRKQKCAGIPDIDVNDEECMNEIIQCIAGDDWMDDDIKGKYRK